jgi:hypothetical protein
MPRCVETILQYKGKIIFIKMFCRLRNTIKTVNIKSCNRKACACYLDFEKRMIKIKGDSPLIETKDYKKYQQCYISRNVFLL